MRVLLDESLPADLAKQLTAVDAQTVSQLQWAGLKNGGRTAALTSPEMALTRLFDDLATEMDRESGAYVRIQRADGSVVEGQVLDLTSTGLRLRSSATEKLIEVSADELRSVDVRKPRRGRELLLAVCAIPAATALLILFARLPWVRPERDILIGFMVLAGITAGLVSVPIVRTLLESWLTKWQRL